MATNSTLPPLPNPHTPLAFLPPILAGQFEASVYLYVASLAAFTWDWLMSIPDEIKMCRQGKLRSPLIAYFLSRIGALGFCILAVVVQAVPVANCNAVIYGIGACFVIGVPSSSALFFFRVRAVYSNNKIITAFFGTLLVALFGLSFFVPLGAEGAHIGTTKRCIFTKVKDTASAPVILNAVSDTLVFVLISVRIMSYSIVGNTPGARIRSFLRGDGLPNFSKSLLQGGQLYYFVTIGLNIVVAAMAQAPVPPVYKAMFSVPNIALESAMACRVFRGVRLGLLKDSNTHDQSTLCVRDFSSLRFAKPPHPTTVGSVNDRGFNSHRPTSPIAVKITKTRESGDPCGYPPGKSSHDKEDGLDSIWVDSKSTSDVGQV